MAQGYKFTFIVNNLSDDLIDTIPGKCSDSGIGTRQGETYIDFDREGPSLGTAIDSALADLKQLGLEPVRVLADLHD